MNFAQSSRTARIEKEIVLLPKTQRAAGGPFLGKSFRHGGRIGRRCTMHRTRKGNKTGLLDAFFPSTSIPPHLPRSFPPAFNHHVPSSSSMRVLCLHSSAPLPFPFCIKRSTILPVQLASSSSSHLHRHRPCPSSSSGTQSTEYSRTCNRRDGFLRSELVGFKPPAISQN
jgi:hypothetical protein